MFTKDEAYSKVSDLVERFSSQIENYKRSEYNETLTRKDFIDPFFEALGWDMNNKAGAWEAYREVMHEDKLKVGGVTTAPDYSFKLAGGQRLFFVEAKKPSVVIKDDVAPAYQVRLYGWNAKLAISVVTDFEEFAIYDCSKKPLRTDKASKGRINYFTYKDYVKEFDFFWNTFSREQVVKGGLIKFQQSDKKGTATVDKDFLERLDTWRKELAANIFKNNPEISEDDLNYAVQQTIDRIIFLRIAEDRALEPYEQLKSCLKNEEAYKELYRQFRVADDKYNSGLFHFKKEKDNPKDPDNISGKLVIENKIIKSIILSLYPPNSDYLFNVLPVEILGSAYEQFLGKQIIVKGSRATIEDKPEVRKAGGVYYTPQYIVEYIVENTVGKLLKDIDEKVASKALSFGEGLGEVSKLKIVDPACGSGSFLLGAYQFLLNYHLKYYADNPQTGKQKNAPLTPDGKLTTAEKKRILLNNIYGVDIDRNAVEVTKLSLLLKCMEGETTASVNTQMTFFHERVLPSLENNIKSGNSLIDVDFYDTQFDFGEEKKIKPFNWQQGFPEVFKQGGFDVVIGNPPYIRIQSIIETSPQQADYLSKKYKSASVGNYDVYVVFVEKALALINEKGKISFILPHKFFTAKYGYALRSMLLEKTLVEQIVHFGHQQVFNNATTYTCILALNKKQKAYFEFNRIESIEDWISSNKEQTDKIEFKDLQNNEWTFNTGTSQKLFKVLNATELKLEDVTDRIFQGLKTGADKIFIVKKVSEGKNHCRVFSAQLNAEVDLEKSLLHPLIKGGDSRGYIFDKTELLIIFPYEKNKSDEMQLISEARLKEHYPAIHQYFKHNKSLLCVRDNGKIAPGKWYGYSRTQALDVISTHKIFAPDISPNASFAIDEVGETFFTGGVSGGYGIKVKQEVSDFYILGLLNSKLLDWFLKKISTQMRGGWYSYEAKYIKNIPIILYNQNNKSLHDEIVKYVDTMLEINKQKQNTTNSETLEQLNQRIAYTDDKINKLVYQLYELTDEEIKAVEGK